MLASGFNRICQEIGEHHRKFGGKHRGRPQVGRDPIVDVNASSFCLMMYETNCGVEAFTQTLARTSAARIRHFDVYQVSSLAFQAPFQICGDRQCLPQPPTLSTRKPVLFKYAFQCMFDSPCGSKQGIDLVHERRHLGSHRG